MSKPTSVVNRVVAAAHGSGPQLPGRPPGQLVSFVRGQVRQPAGLLRRRNAVSFLLSAELVDFA